MAIILRGRGNDIIHTGRQNDIILAGAGDDWVYSGSRRDLLFGGSGNDTLDGGAGGDTIFAQGGDDTVIFNAYENRGNGRQWDRYDGGSGQDTLQLELTSEDWNRPEIRAEVEAFMAQIAGVGKSKAFCFDSLHLRVKGFENLNLFIDGQPYNPRIEVIDLSGSTENETVTIASLIGSDVKTGSGNDTITGGPGDDTISSGNGDDYIYLGDGNDVVFSGSGNDTVIAGQGGGYDYIDMGQGIDTVQYSSVTGSINVDLRPTDRSSISFIEAGISNVGEMLISQGLPANFAVGLTTGAPVLVDTDILIGVENVVGGSGNDTITGDANANRLDGADGDDLIDGQAEEDVLIGGQGSDTLNGGLDNDTLEGGTGDDTIDGGGGFDALVLTGNSGDYTVQTLGNGLYSVTDNGGQGDGVDTFSQVEQITFADTTVGLWTLVGFIDILGTNDDDILNGTAARERFYGFDGDDLMLGDLEEDDFIGGRGNDTMDGGGPQDDLNFVWDSVAYAREYDDAVASGFIPLSGVTVNLASGIATDVYGDTDTLIEIERVYGTRLDDDITGSDADEAFDPHGGADTINGGGGFDNLNYNLTDEYYEGMTHGIVVNFSMTIAGSGTVIDPVDDIDVFTGIEVVRGTRYDDVFNGGLGSQQFRGYGGNDTFDGGADIDVLNYRDDANYGGFGGIAFDLSITDGAGYATVVDGFGNQDLVTNIEEFRGTGAADVMRGDGNENIFEGNVGADQLFGAGGSDELRGGFGDDTLDGGAENDILYGDGGMDALTGGTGNDSMQGGAGADQFVFAPGDGFDQIDDFEYLSDRLELNNGLTIATLTESDVDGNGGLDTTVTFSSGDEVVLLDISGIADPNDLL